MQAMLDVFKGRLNKMDIMDLEPTKKSQKLKRSSRMPLMKRLR
jgi:hypothetical protein